ncbi:hypothetical protein BCV70DRAFT_116532 [Testicularia cyperi]|uniref:Uncharacterized protein n=1 Tax=Testicularia cyperi TaxID=1882483 RepID=A0A317XLX2_9BASI|nr:hypothetical protein BCV70DRAFT_116532 [Testicularia cyperi]
MGWRRSGFIDASARRPASKPSGAVSKGQNFTLPTLRLCASHNTPPPVTRTVLRRTLSAAPLTFVYHQVSQQTTLLCFAVLYYFAVRLRWQCASRKCHRSCIIFSRCQAATTAVAICGSLRKIDTRHRRSHLASPASLVRPGPVGSLKPILGYCTLPKGKTPKPTLFRSCPAFSLFFSLLASSTCAASIA